MLDLSFSSAEGQHCCTLSKARMMREGREHFLSRFCFPRFWNYANKKYFPANCEGILPPILEYG